MRRLLVLGVVALLGVGWPACNRPSSQAAGRLSVNGRAEVVTIDGALRSVTGSRTLKAGEQVTVADGTAILSLGNGRSLELRKGTVLRLGLQTGPAGTRVARGELVKGDVLVQALEDPATVVAGDSTVEVVGAARVSRALAVVVGVYRGAAGVQTAGRPASVPTLRQRTVPAPGLPSRPTPLTYSASDPWDQRFLGDAIDLGNQLAATSLGFTNPPGVGPGSTVGLFRQILPQLSEQPGFDASLIDSGRPPGETLVGAAISLDGTKGTFPERWASVFTFHDDGASWGLVALDQGVKREPLIATLDDAIRRTTVTGREVASPAPGTPSSRATPSPVPVPLPSGSSGGSSSGAPGSTGAPGSGAGSPGSGADGTGPAAGGSGGGGTQLEPFERITGPSNLGVPLVDNTVNSVVETLSGLLRAIGRE